MPSREPIQEDVGLGVQVQFFAPITVLLGQPRRQELQSTLARSSSGFALSCGLEGRGLQCEPGDLNEKAGCGGSAGLCAELLCGFCLLVWSGAPPWGLFCLLAGT